MAKGSRGFRMETAIKVNTRTTGSTASGLTNGNKIRLPTRVALKMGSDTARVSGLQDKLNTLVATLKDSRKDMDSCTFPAATFIRGTLLRTSAKAMEKCFGQTGPSIKEIGKEVFRMEKVRST